MSYYYLTEFVDTHEDIKFSSSKDTNLEAIRLRFVKYGAPVGTIKLQLLNEAKDAILGESESINCNYSTDSRYVGTDAAFNMSWIRFNFNGEAIRQSINYYLRVIPDATYISGRDASNHLNLAIDYPKPTNIGNNDTFENTYGSNFMRYPQGVLQMFGKDYG